MSACCGIRVAIWHLKMPNQISQVSISPTFYIKNHFAKLFSSYSLALKFFGKRVLAQKLHINVGEIDISLAFLFKIISPTISDNKLIKF